MFIRSTIDIIFDYGQGFFDSLASLIFFMLLGNYPQKPMTFYLLKGILSPIFRLQLLNKFG